MLLLVTLSTNAQIVQSSCSASDSIITLYSDDADKLALDRILRNNLPYADSVLIPQEYSDTILNALIAVYNATGLPARDTVVDLYHIHACTVGVLRRMVIGADSSQLWMQQLKNGIIPTGVNIADSLMAAYNLSVYRYNSYNSLLYPGSHIVEFITDRNYNMNAMADLWDTVPGVLYGFPHFFLCPGFSLEDSIYPDHVELTYSRGWGDCAAGCPHRYWKFNVYFDCSVEYLGSYGATVPLGIKDQSCALIKVIPNPFKRDIKLDGVTPPFVYSICDMSGRIVVQGKSSNDEISNLDGLKRGLYFLMVNKPEINFKFKIIKE